MSKLDTNIVANYIGVGFTSLMSVVVVPMYLGILGAEAYGLVGFFMAFQAMVGMLYLGLSTVVSREVSKRLASGVEQNPVGRLVSTIEMAYWIMGSLSGGVLLIWAYFAGHSWFQLSKLVQTRLLHPPVYLP
jgi:O-antigen/teichoic acid export membrane protein